MAGMFQSATAFNQSIGTWDTSSVTNIRYMFYGATSFNQSIGNWVVSAVTLADYAFQGATVFEGTGIGNWNTSSLVNMNNMFYGAIAFNQPIVDWDTSSVTTMQYAFYGATAFNGAIGDWDTSSVTTMKYAFYGATAFNQPIGDWDTSSLVNMENMFNGATAFNQPIGDWDTSSVTDMLQMFQGATAFNQPIGTWDTSSVTTMRYAFYDATSFNQDIGDWDVSEVTLADHMFHFSSFSLANYELLLVGWSTIDPDEAGLQSGINFNLENGVFVYCNTAITAAKNILTGTYSWVISGDTQNCPPEITGGDTADLSVVENQIAVATITSTDVDVTDPDNRFSTTLTGADSSLFNITAGGVLTFITAPDYENPTSSTTSNVYNVIVTAQDDGGLTDTQSITVTVTNVDEVVPTITSGTTGTDKAENSGAVQTIYTITATANDGGTIASYAIAGDDAGLLSVNASTGVVTLTADPDYENKNSYSFTVTATDELGTSVPTEVTFNITNVDEVVPTITSGTTGTDKAENSGAVQTIYTITATANDGGTIASYAIAGDDAGLLSVNASTGVVTLTADPDYENKNSYSFTVTAADELGTSVPTEVTFNITNVDEVVPTITSAATGTNLVENTLVGQTIYTITADANDGGTISSYNIAGTDAGLLSVDASTGVVTLEVDPDYENKNSYSFTVTASDELGTSVPTEVTFNIINVDEVVIIDEPVMQLTSITSNVVITGTGYLTLTGGAGIIGSVELSSGAQLSLKDAGIIEGNVELSSEAKLTLEGAGSIEGNVIITQGGSLIATEGSITGAITYKRTLPTTNWYLISSPVIGQDKDEFVAASNLAVDSGTNLGFCNYDNSSANWTFYQSGASGTGDFVSGEGHSVKLNVAGEVVFTGDFNNADASIAVTAGTNGLNLIGNPYLASVSVFEMLTQTDNLNLLSERTVWLWDESESLYVAKNLTEDLEVAPGQGFFVNVASSGNFIITESMQSHAEDTFQRGETSSKVALSISNGEAIKRASVFYIDGATTGFDNGYDSSIFEDLPAEFSLYTRAVANENGRNLGIQSLPKGDYQNIIVPVGIRAASKSTLAFSASSQNLTEGTYVYLEDRVTNSFTRIDNNTYNVSLSSTLDGVGRFYMHTISSSLGNDNLTFNGVKIFSLDNRTLRVLGVEQQAKLKLYSILGAEVLKTNFIGTGANNLALPYLKTGIYILELDTNKGVLNKKIIIE